MAQNIKLADISDNCFDIAKNDPDFAKVYIREKLETIEVLGEANFTFKRAVATQLRQLLDELCAETA